MFDHTVAIEAPLDAGQVEAWVERLASSAGPDADDARVADRGVRVEKGGRGVGAEVALARRESHHRGRQHVGLARILADEMPCTRRALRAGRISEWKATILVRETACLSLADRQEVDRRLAGDLERLEKRGVRELEGAARALAGELDAAACVLRRRIAESQRHVTVRPAPDTITRLSAELPVATGVAVFKSLSDAADSARAGGDPRSRGQLMADTLAERVLGTVSGVVPVEIELVVTDEVLLGEAEDSAHLEGFGPIPAELARELIERADEQGLATLRRLYRRPATGQLVAMDSRSRCFTGGLARFIRLRDQTCRTPWCDAPIRHTDHPEPVTADGETSRDNGQGLCEACNYAKEARGWSVRVIHTEPHTVEIRTASGQVLRSTAPPLPGHVPRGVVPRIDLAFSYSAA